MALYAEIEKIDETDREVRYQFADAAGRERIMLLDKVSGRTAPEDGREDYLYRAVARKVAVCWLREGAAPGRLLVQS
ncbi:hypothetical protein IHE55_16595 [Streptomyces pactum]|uniref:WYL domain-containing protein n=1 Tax=Streptomyces pactum TaxID=68249 RepID=A0ABS0NM97_9ACTN|nr:hypothetical protein [Streptomyces pactum]MBH5336306.1 hypothetical protein [Streptomyces pactum]